MRIAFASCSSVGKQKEQPVWGIIHRQKPDILLLLGDNVYIGKKGYAAEPIEKKKQILESKYIKQLNEVHFRKLIDEVPFLVVWDNHDFGLPGHKYDGDGPRWGHDVSEEHRTMAFDLFRHYLQCRSLAPREKKVYCSYTFKKENIKLIMLDVRSFQENPHRVFPSRHHPTLLGKDQEEWLKNELVNNEAEINIICSGLAYSEGGVCWENHPDWCAKFKEMLTKTSKTLFLGGNVHSNKIKIQGLTSRPQHFFEIISSGVGQNYKPEHFQDDEDDDDECDCEENEFPRNNYGIIDVTDSVVQVSLYGQNRQHLHCAVIKRDDWSLKKYWRMRSSKMK